MGFLCWGFGGWWRLAVVGCVESCFSGGLVVASGVVAVFRGLGFAGACIYRLGVRFSGLISSVYVW